MGAVIAPGPTVGPRIHGSDRVSGAGGLADTVPGPVAGSRPR